jgi:hypothetical protein
MIGGDRFLVGGSAASRAMPNIGSLRLRRINIEQGTARSTLMIGRYRLLR